jgi:hypothetical protein
MSVLIACVCCSFRADIELTGNQIPEGELRAKDATSILHQAKKRRYLVLVV